MVPGLNRRLRLALAAVLLVPLAGCKPPVNVTEISATPTPVPTPEPSPTPLYVPYKHMDTGRLFNGIQFAVSFST